MKVFVNGRPLHVSDEATAAVACLQAGASTRVSAQGEPRAPLCGMGICYECRAVIDGVPHERCCVIPCREGMRIDTDA
jgi:sarcosine oxidase subunit alpha